MDVSHIQGGHTPQEPVAARGHRFLGGVPSLDMVAVKGIIPIFFFNRI